MQITADEGAHLAQVQDVLRLDAAFSAEVLRLANSPLLGARREITNILHAVAILGLERIKALTTTLAVRIFLSGKPSDAMQTCWRRNLAVAIVSAQIARYVDMDADTCYTAGLLHDIGRLALLWACPDEYAGILAQPMIESRHLLEMEKELFGMDHCEAGEWILTQWEFPLQLREVALLHNRNPEPGASSLLLVVYTALQIADAIGFPISHQSTDRTQMSELLPNRLRQSVLDNFDQIAEDTIFRLNAVECSLL